MNRIYLVNCLSLCEESRYHLSVLMGGWQHEMVVLHGGQVEVARASWRVVENCVRLILLKQLWSLIRAQI